MRFIKATFLLIYLLPFFLLSCDNESLKNNFVKVKYVESICCGDLMTINNQLVTSICEAYKDSLLVPINKDDFAIFEALEFGNVITIEYELTEFCEGTPSCEIICNRSLGVPIKIISIKNE